MFLFGKSFDKCSRTIFSVTQHCKMFGKNILNFVWIKFGISLEKLKSRAALFCFIHAKKLIIE